MPLGRRFYPDAQCVSLRSVGTVVTLYPENVQTRAVNVSSRRIQVAHRDVVVVVVAIVVVVVVVVVVVECYWFLMNIVVDFLGSWNPCVASNARIAFSQLLLCFPYTNLEISRNTMRFHVFFGDSDLYMENTTIIAKRVMRAFKATQGV